MVPRLIAVSALAAFTLTALAQATGPANLVHNADFEAAPSAAAPIPEWTTVNDGNGSGSVTLENDRPSSDRSPHSLKIAVKATGQRFGAATGGLSIRGDQWYEVDLMARTENNLHIGLVFSLESADGQTVSARATLPEIGGNWNTYHLALHAQSALDNARLVISPIEPGAIWLDDLSLAPRSEKR
jgi:hypothetical protein